MRTKSFYEILVYRNTIPLCDGNLLKDAGFLRSSAGKGTPQLKVPHTSFFDGVRNEKTLENFNWDMKRYFKAAKVPKVEQISLVGMYLTGDAKVWWRTQYDDDARIG